VERGNLLILAEQVEALRAIARFAIAPGLPGSIGSGALSRQRRGGEKKR
jgi:hypothetical protein